MPLIVLTKISQYWVLALKTSSVEKVPCTNFPQETVKITKIEGCERRKRSR